LKKEIIGKYVAISGLLLFWAPLWGIADSYFIMASSFQEITLFGTNEPRIAADEMSSAAMSTALGFLLCIVALILLAVSVVGLNYRTSWLFWALVIYSTLLLFMIPLGTLFGLIVLTVLVLNRKKFGPVNHIT
jgi:hypothetical protein